MADFGVTFLAQIWAKNPDLEDSSFFPRRCCKEGRSIPCGLTVDYTGRCVLQPFKEEGLKTIRIFAFLYFSHFCTFCNFGDFEDFVNFVNFVNFVFFGNFWGWAVGWDG